MHENAVMTSIVDIVLKKRDELGFQRVTSITVRGGETRNLEVEWMQHYFDFYAKGTAAEGAKIELVVSPLVFECNRCKLRFHPDQYSHETIRCPSCNAAEYEMISGRELLIESITTV